MGLKSRQITNFLPSRMIKAYQKIEKLSVSLWKFSTAKNEFANANVRQLIDGSSEEDRKIFNLDLKKLDWEKYWETYISGIREYLIKESWDTLPYALVKWRR